ncbi:MAG: MBL fold metallo-hydrolase [Verrucomicrobiota bacterium]
MLEDDFTWVIRKAFKGLALAPGEAALRAGLPETEVMSFSKGRFSADTARRLAPVLGLNPEALANHADYHPRALDRPEIHRLDLPFGGERVNAWLVDFGPMRFLFDTGNDAHSCIDAISALNTGLPQLTFITHGHRDHTGGIPSLDALGIPVLGPEMTGPKKFSAREVWDLDGDGGFILQGIDLSGHYVPSVGVLLREADQPPVLVTGDALFAGSIGGCDTPDLYQLALRNLRAALAPLPDDTILLPGHGPATTLGEERVSNPFL